MKVIFIVFKSRTRLFEFVGPHRSVKH